MFQLVSKVMLLTTLSVILSLTFEWNKCLNHRAYTNNSYECLNLPQTQGIPILPGILAGFATAIAGFVLEKALTKAFIEYMSIFKF